MTDLGKRTLSRGLLGVLACGLPSLVNAAPEPAPERLVAVVDVFSGRPNPEVLLRADAVAPSAQADHALLADKLKAACEEGRPRDAKEAPAYPARLGYRGVTVYRQVGQDSYEEVARVYRGVVRLAPQAAASRCAREAARAEALYADDAGAALEARLVRMAADRGVLPEAALKAALAGLESPNKSQSNPERR